MKAKVVSIWRSSSWLLTVCVVCGALYAPSGALGATQRGHVFSFSYGSKGKGEGQFFDPAGVAVSDDTGDVYLADRKTKRVVQLEPVLENGELIGERWVRSFPVPSPSAIAVDNSETEGALEADPSVGDVYVVGDGGKAIYKFTSEGTPVGVPIKHFEAREGGAGSRIKMEGIEGVAVDSAGSLFAWEQSGEVFRFGDQEANNDESGIATGLEGAPGFALDAQDNYFVGTVAAETGLPALAKLEGLTGRVLCDPLSAEASAAVAVNTQDVPANNVDEQNDVYVAELSEDAGGQRTTIVQLTSATVCPSKIQSFGRPELKAAGGIAVDKRTGTVFLTDAVSDELDVFALEKAGPPTIEALSAGSGAAVSGATHLRARIDPRGSDTHYSFEYGAESCAAKASACMTTAPVDLGGSFGEAEVGLELSGLAPGIYHFRLRVENAFAQGFSAVYSAERTFVVTEVLGGLLDGRAWELVSPPVSHGASIEALTREGGVIVASETGSALTYVTSGFGAEDAQGNRAPEKQQVLATRGASGWTQQDIVTPQTQAYGFLPGSAPEYRFFSSDLSLALVQPFGTQPPLAPGVSGSTAYLRDDPPIRPQAPEVAFYEQAGANSLYLAPGFLPLGTIGFLGATPDLSHVVLATGTGLSEWSGGALKLVSELPGGGGPPEAGLGYDHDETHAISSDGSRVIWTASQEQPAHLYMRDFAMTPAGTIQLDKAQGVSEPPSAAAEFQVASSDASRVFFTDRETLTSPSSAEPVRGYADLYVYECGASEQPGSPGCKLVDLTVDHHEGEFAEVQSSVLGASEDGSSISFVARGVLSENENANGEQAGAGDDNLYEAHYQSASAGWQTTFIAVLSDEDSPDWDAGLRATESDKTFQTARVSPNGQYLAFMSQRPLTGYDNEDASSESHGERRDEEVYLYDASAKSLTCVSCNPAGRRPTGVLDDKEAGEGIGLVVDRPETWSERWLAGSLPGWTAQSINSAIYQSRYLSNAGRLFFNSADALTPDVTLPTRNEEISDKQQRVGVENVYEYEPAGVGSCATGSGSGCLALISSGTSEHESAFLEATPTGDDAFFLTSAQLLPQHSEPAFAIYDARVCATSSPCLPPASALPPLCATTEACRPAVPTPPFSVGPLLSETFYGPGNIITPPMRGVEASKTTSKPPSKAQKLSAALALCKKQHPHAKKKRRSCEAHARALYVPKPHTKQTAGHGRSQRGGR